MKRSFFGSRHSALFGGRFLEKSSGGFLLFASPSEVLELRSTDTIRSFFEELEKRLSLGFCLAGYVSYEAGYGFENSFSQSRRSDTRRGPPLACFGVYDEPFFLTQEEGATLLSGDFVIDDPSFDPPINDYTAAVREIRKQIAAGNVYQVNYTGRFRFRFRGSVPGFFGQLIERQPGAYPAWLVTDAGHILSVSPELFFRSADGIIETRPMKGTAERGKSPADDMKRLEWLQADRKNLAENLMIVDLLRNDLGRICRPGSVEVPDLFVGETYPTLHQMVSSVRGELKPETSLYDMFRALFPCGSVTGAPKIRAMQLIEKLEGSSRGVYTGSTGFILPKRAMCFNVAIRTVALSGDRGEYGAGSGIVWDSEPEKEFDECALKTDILDNKIREAFGIFETMLYNGTYVWFEEHLARMARSARQLGFLFNDGAIRKRLIDFAETELSGTGRYKIRIELSRDGSLSLFSDPLSCHVTDSPLRVCRASYVSGADDYFRRHKTTLRGVYDRIYRKAIDAGYDEVLFCNERDEVTEGAISNILIYRNGQYVTPPLSSGLLDGIYRRYFLETRLNAHEAVLGIDEIESADLFYICNSVRGLRRAVLCSEVL